MSFSVGARPDAIERLTHGAGSSPSKALIAFLVVLGIVGAIAAVSHHPA